jgi:hypothetical protein
MIPKKERSTRSRVVSIGCWFSMNSSVIAFIMARTSLLLTHSFSSSSGGGMVNIKRKTNKLVID